MPVRDVKWPTAEWPFPSPKDESNLLTYPIQIYCSALAKWISLLMIEAFDNSWRFELSLFPFSEREIDTKKDQNFHWYTLALCLRGPEITDHKFCACVCVNLQEDVEWNFREKDNERREKNTFQSKKKGEKGERENYDGLSLFVISPSRSPISFLPFSLHFSVICVYFVAPKPSPAQEKLFPVVKQYITANEAEIFEWRRSAYLNSLMTQKLTRSLMRAEQWRRKSTSNWAIKLPNDCR